MSDPNDIRKALTAAWSALATAQGWASSVAWPNKTFIPVTGTTWFRATVLKGIPQTVEMGPYAQQLNTGIMQIDVFAPKDEGEGPAEIKAKSITDAFPIGGSCSYGSSVLRFENAYAMTGIIEDAYYHVIIRVEYRTEI